MIRCVTGMPGAGKTNFLVHIAHKELAKGRKVFSNIAIKGAYKITFQDLIEYTFPHGSVLLIDEAGRDMNARKWKDLPDEIFDLFTLHRHLGLDMYVAVQNFGYLDSQLRRVIELTYWVKNSPILPFYRLEGYYDLEKLGSMKNPDIKSIYWKSRKVRARYNHTSMSKVFYGKFHVPQVEWFPAGFRYKNRFQTLIQFIRIKWKKKKRDKRLQKKYLKEIEGGFE